ncbi:MAG: hypothetical protein JXA94_01220 [Parachlamydiales bacterium]|nr:hypothetical protein [Parachlamydiales bacterium]
MFDNISSIKALNFLDLKISVNKITSLSMLINKNNLLPSFEKFLNQEKFADVYMAFSKDGIYFYFEVSHPFSKINFEEYRRGDSVEIFIDTRSLKTQGYITKFCHHFVFFPEEKKGHQAKEVTKFRIDDMHKIADPNDFIVSSKIKPQSYFIEAFLPNKVLFGFNLNERNNISFCYRINRYLQPAQTFNISLDEHIIEKSPHLWAEISLKD